jgi:hypothetical protein
MESWAGLELAEDRPLPLLALPPLRRSRDRSGVVAGDPADVDHSDDCEYSSVREVSVSCAAATSAASRRAKRRFCAAGLGAVPPSFSFSGCGGEDAGAGEGAGAGGVADACDEHAAGERTDADADAGGDAAGDLADRRW